jgi:hypothetical protein
VNKEETKMSLSSLRKERIEEGGRGGGNEREGEERREG